MPGRRLSFYEFFAGGGMARAGLGAGWTCLFANDIDADKAASYRLIGAARIFRRRSRGFRAGSLPGHADLAWASFPCQDLSLAGGGKGMGGADDALKPAAAPSGCSMKKSAARRRRPQPPRHRAGKRGRCADLPWQARFPRARRHPRRPWLSRRGAHPRRALVHPAIPPARFFRRPAKISVLRLGDVKAAA